MGLKDLFNRGGDKGNDKGNDKAGEASTETALEVAPTAKEKTDFKDIKNKAAELKDKAFEFTTKAAELTGLVAEYGWDKLKDAIESTFQEIQSLRPVLEKSGFIIGEIDLVLSIPPSFEVAVVQTGTGVSDLAELEQNKELTKMQRLFVSSLKNTYALNGVFEKYNYTIGRISVCIGIPPKVHVHLVNRAANLNLHSLPTQVEPKLLPDTETPPSTDFA